MTRNQIDYWRNVETERANKANEGINKERARADLMSAETAAKRQSMEAYWKPYEVDIQDVNSKANVASAVGKIAQAFNPMKMLGSMFL